MDVRSQLMDHAPRLRRYAYTLIRNRELSDDLVQDTLEHTLKHIGLFRSGRDLCGWLCTIILNAFANQTRNASARAVHVSTNDVTIANNLMAPDQTILLEIRDLECALSRLPPRQREVLLLVGPNDLSCGDIALALDIPVGTVMSRLSHGRERLRELMAGEMFGNCKRCWSLIFTASLIVRKPVHTDWGRRGNGGPC